MMHSDTLPPRKFALYTTTEIRAVEEAVKPTLPPGTLMRRAGKAAAELAATLISGPKPKHGAPVLVIAGPGNNGGDGLETAARLADAGRDVRILLLADPVHLPHDARQAYERAEQSKAKFLGLPQFLGEQASVHWALVVDGMFGIGLQRAISGTHRRLVEIVNALPCAVLSLDTPSGLDVDTGAIVGEDGCAVHATHTITFIADKPGLHTASGRDFSGQVHVSDLGIAPDALPDLSMLLNSPDLFGSALHPRRHASHKGDFGDLYVIGGATGMMGAAILAASAAAKCGAGRTFAVFMGEAPGYDPLHPEIMFRAAQQMDFSHGVLLIGPGLGMSHASQDAVLRAVSSTLPLVLDADALNLVAGNHNLRTLLTRRNGITLLTPHPLEAGRLLGMSAGEVQGDRIAVARRLAQEFNATTILKGSGTIIASPECETAINPTGNPALATAGTGDVLAGICGALLAQGLSAHAAGLAAVWLHGAAADELVAQGVGPVGLAASELIGPVRNLLNRLITQR